MKKKIVSFALATGVLLSSGGFAHASLGDDIINTGDNYLGTPYRFGSAFGNTNSFDCSSFTSFVFSKHGISIPRTSVGQATAGTAVSKANLQKGDLVFYDTDRDGVINHAGIYAGNGKMLNAQSSKGIAFTDAFSSYWGPRYVTARRVISSNNVTSVSKTVAAAPQQKSTVSATGQHKVQKGDTLWGISRKYNTTVANIQTLNSLKNTNLYIGQVLKVNGKAPATVQTAKPAVTKSATSKVYIVKRGDTLWGISKSNGVTVTQLTKSNKLQSTMIYPGQKLNITK